MHTKGEWVAKGTDIFLNVDGKFTGYKLARVQRSVCFEIKISKDEAEANARLMAAAADMFEDLNEMLNRMPVDMLSDGEEFRTKVKATLKKAKGE